MQNENQKPNLYTLFQKMGQIEGKVDSIITRLDRMDGRFCAHDDRINKVEGNVDEMRGKAVMAGGITAFIISVIGVLIAWFKK